MVIWSLFDGSGIMGLPWAEAGHDVYCFNSDEGNHGGYEAIRMNHPKIRYVNLWIDEGFAAATAAMKRPDFIFSFPDCTELAASGAKHAHHSLQSVRMAIMVQEFAESIGAGWLVENPVGKMSTEWRKPDHYFDPYEFGGYLLPHEETFHPRMPARDAYTKKTCIWCGGLKWPDKKPVEHIGKFWGWAYLGGKSPKTKQLRSLTPRGFARAVYEANHA
ncbi:DNA cytosine methyltransferase [Klebsiella aerogenes]|nr:DNA cytosine methyltransferase [Klebsiella aerogenes]